MDIEKNLASTYDPDFLLKDHFIYNNTSADLYVYEDYVCFTTDHSNDSLHFTSETIF